MAKKYYEGTDYTFDTDWGKEETTGLPLSGGAVQQVIKDKVAEIETSLGRKVGYIYENNQSSMFEFWTSEYDYRNNTEGCKIGETPKVKAYGMEKYMGPNNQTVFISSNKNKIFTWGYKTFDNQSKVSFPEKATVNFTVTSGGSPKTTTTIVGTNNADEIIDDFCVFNTNLDDRLAEGVNEIKINITGETTKVQVSIEYTITVVNFDLKDTTQFEGTNKNSLSLLPEIVCTNGQDYFVEYKLNGGEYVIGRNDTGNGNKQTPSISVNLSELNDGKHICEYRGGILINGKHHYSKTQRIEFVKNNDGLIDKPQVLIFSEYIDGDKITEDDGNLIINNIQQYIPYSVKYSVYTPDGRNANVMFKNKLDGSEFNINTDSSKAYTFDGQLIEYGIIPFDIFVNEEFNRTIYLNVGDSGLNIKFHNTNLRIDFSSVNKNNNSDEKEEWISQITENGVVRYHNKVTFNDTFDWSQGWTKDGLVIGENSVATFDYCPFPKQEFDADNDVKEEWVGGSIDGSGIVRPYTFEIEFKTQNISDENVVLCDLMREDGKKTGIRITGNLFEFYVSENEKVSCRFKEGEMNRIAVVIRPQYSKDKDGKEVTIKRLYLETMENVLGNSDKVIIDSSAKGNNVIPYLPLDKLNKGAN